MSDPNESGMTVTAPNPMEALLADAFGFPNLRSGDTVDGRIVSISPNEILVDIGYKSDGVVDPHELDRLDADFLASLHAGDSVAAFIVRPEDHDGNVVVSLLRAQQEQDWREAEELQQNEEIFTGVVTGFNRGGAIVRVGRVRGFVPASQLSDRWHGIPGDSSDPEQRWARLIGQEMQLKVMEIDRRRNRLILSERAAVREWRKSQKDRLLSELKQGAVVSGVVSGLAAFGAFVDIGGADGLIHLSELSWQRVGHPGEVVQIGQQVKVCILSVDEERKRIALSLRQLQPEPWSTVAVSYQVGQVTKATITKLTDFGAFARLEDGIEGLIHLTELAEHRVSHPREVVSEGQEVMVRIMRVEPERRRLGLSLRQANEAEYLEVDWAEESSD
jgi:small subunit ribosomal protein S1